MVSRDVGLDPGAGGRGTSGDDTTDTTDTDSGTTRDVGLDPGAGGRGTSGDDTSRSSGSSSSPSPTRTRTERVSRDVGLTTGGVDAVERTDTTVDVSGDVPAAGGDPGTDFDPVEIDTSTTRVGRPGGRTVAPEAVARADPVTTDTTAAADDGPGPVATALGTGIERLGDSPTGRTLGAGVDGVFGDPADPTDRGLASGLDDRLARAERGFQSFVVDPLAEADPGAVDAETFGGVRPFGISGEDVQDTAVRTAELSNVPGFARDALTVTEGVGRGGQFLAEGGPDAVETAGDVTAAGARAAPGATRTAAEFAAENPRDVAVTGTAVVATGGLATAGLRGGRVATSRAVDTADDISPGGTVNLDDFVADTRAQTGRTRRRSQDTDDRIEITADEIDPRQLDFDPTADPRTARVAPREQRGGVTHGDDIDAADPFQRRRDQRVRGDRVVDDRSQDIAFERSLAGDTQAAAPPATSSTPGLAGVGGGLGTIAAVNDPTGIADVDSPAGVGSGADGAVGDFGLDQTAGSLDATNDPTGIADDESTTGTGVGTGTGTETASDTAADGTEIGGQPGQAGTTTVQASTTVSATATGVTTGQFADPTLADPTVTEPTRATTRTPRSGSQPPRTRGPDLPDALDDDVDAMQIDVDTELVENPTRGLDEVDRDLSGVFDAP